MHTFTVIIFVNIEGEESRFLGFRASHKDEDAVNDNIRAQIQKAINELPASSDCTYWELAEKVLTDLGFTDISNFDGALYTCEVCAG